MNPKTTPAALQSQVSGSSFYAGMRVLPKAEREAMYAIYAFCRAVDDIADDQIGDRAARAAELDAWRADIDALYAGREPGRAALVAGAKQSFDLEQADFHAVIDGMAMDVERDIRWPSASELDLYCDRVASAVGRLSVRVFGMDHKTGEALSHHLGRALQLTNILRDVGEDWRMGRVYLPQDELAAYDLCEADLARGQVDARWRAFMRFQRARARRLYDEAWPGIALLERDGRLAVAAAATFYRALLDDIAAHDDDVFTRRAHVGTWGKLRRLPVAWWRSR